MNKIFVFIVLFFLSICSLSAQTVKEKQVYDAVENLKIAMVSGDRQALSNCVSEHLTYGHSGGHIEGKEEFVENIASGKSVFVKISLSEQTIQVFGKTAIVRHILDADTNDNGKPNVVKLKVLLVFMKEQGKWKLLARQAVKFH